MKSRLLVAVVLLMCVDATAALAQGRGRRSSNPGWGFQPLAHRAEIAGYYGYSWLSDYEVDVFLPNATARRGRLDVKSSDFWGVELNVNVRPGAQLALVYNRTDSRLEFKPNQIGQPVEDLGKLAVEYWHVGGYSGVARGNVMPFGGVTLGATRFSNSIEDAWKFSLTPQLGVKVFPHPKIGIRGQVRVPMTIIDGGFGFGFSSGGGSFASVGGTGVFQFDVSGGVMILL